MNKLKDHAGAEPEINQNVGRVKQGVVGHLAV